MLADDALRKTEGIDPKRVFVLGHSQGGMMAPRIAAMSGHVAGLVLLVALLIGRTPLPDLREQESAVQQRSDKTLWQHREFVTGVITQFFYVGAQVGVGAFFINYVTEHWAQMSNQQAAYLLSVAMLSFMFGRFFSTWLMGRVNAQRLLLTYALINTGLCVVVVSGLEGVSVIALVAS